MKCLCFNPGVIDCMHFMYIFGVRRVSRRFEIFRIATRLVSLWNILDCGASPRRFSIAPRLVSLSDCGTSLAVLEYSTSPYNFSSCILHGFFTCCGSGTQTIRMVYKPCLPSGIQNCAQTTYSVPSIRKTAHFPCMCDIINSTLMI